MKFEPNRKMDGGPFHNPKDSMVKQAVLEAHNQGKQTVRVSRAWFDKVRSVFMALGAKVTDESAESHRLRVRFLVDPKLGEMDYEVE